MREKGETDEGNTRVINWFVVCNHWHWFLFAGDLFCLKLFSKFLIFVRYHAILPYLLHSLLLLSMVHLLWFKCIIFVVFLVPPNKDQMRNENDEISKRAIINLFHFHAYRPWSHANCKKKTSNCCARFFCFSCYRLVFPSSLSFSLTSLGV